MVILRRLGGAIRDPWAAVAGVTIALVLVATPAQAESPCDSSTVIPEGQEALRADCEILWKFYTDLEDPGVLDDADNENAWGSTNPLAEWQGVGVGSNGVTVLFLPDTQLKGSISPDLGRLPMLHTLEMHTNQLTGSIPAELGQLSDLQRLVLHSNQLTGSIPPELGDLSKLNYVDLGGNDFTGSIPPEIGKLAELEYLVVHSSRLTGPIPPQLADLTKLKRAYLYGNELTGSIPQELGGLANLEVLSLASNQLTGSIPPEFAQLANLIALVLYGNQLTGPIPPELGQLANLSLLNLHGNQFAGSIPLELGQLANLTFLSLSSNGLTGSIPTELESLVNLEQLHLGNNRLSGHIPPQLGDLTKLTRLRLYSNELTGSIPGELGQLANLTVLNLHSNQLAGPIPPELGQLSSLTSLSLSNNELTGSIPPELGRLVKLTFLSLHSNALTGSIPPELESLVNLETLRMSGNRLTGPIPPGLADLIEPAVKDQIDPYSADPLGLIAHAQHFRQYSLGATVWNVWFCDVPLGDAPIKPEVVERRLNREVSAYFDWASGGRYEPSFQVVPGWVSGDSRQECWEAVEGQEHDFPLLLVENSPANDGYAAGRGLVVVGGGTVVATPGYREPRLSTVVHEIGHALGFPHSFGGRIRWSPEGQFSGVYEYDNPMDMMSGDLALGLRSGTIAVNRYAAGWIEPEEVAIHEPGTTAVYELRPVGAGGTQLLVLRGFKQGVFTALGARIAIGYDSAIPRQGVEVYSIDQRETACEYPWNGACSGTNRRTRPNPPAEPGAGYGDTLYSRGRARLVEHVRRPGDVFEIGRATIEVIERVGNNFSVRVVDTSTPAPPPEPVAEPSYEGRFSDDDGSVHEANIEVMAELGITLGCNPPDNDRYCPKQVVKRSQMMAFLARALGEENGSDATTSRFSDVPDDAWYLSSLERLADLGIVEPYEDGAFRPSEPVTRLDMAVFMSRAFSGVVEVEEPAGVFGDVPADSEFAGAVEGILAAGVTTGCSADPLLYCPDKPVRRDQMASFLARALKGA